MAVRRPHDEVLLPDGGPPLLPTSPHRFEEGLKDRRVEVFDGQALVDRGEDGAHSGRPVVRLQALLEVPDKLGRVAIIGH